MSTVPASHVQVHACTLSTIFLPAKRLIQLLDLTNILYTYKRLVYFVGKQQISLLNGLMFVTLFTLLEETGKARWVLKSA